MKRLYIFGASSLGLYAQSVAESMREFEVCGFFDDHKTTASSPTGVRVVGTTEDFISSERFSAISVFVAIGDNAVRSRITQRISGVSKRVDFPLLVDPTARIDSRATVGSGSIVLAGAVIGPHTKLGRFCVVGANATIGALARVADFVNIAPGANIGSEADLDTGAFIGLGAAILQRRTVGFGAVVGAGAVVVDPVVPRTRVVGIPAKELTK